MHPPSESIEKHAGTHAKPDLMQDAHTIEALDPHVIDAPFGTNRISILFDPQ